MNPLRILCIVASLLAVCGANPTNQLSNAVSGSLKPSNWLTPSELENTPSLDELSLQKLEQMPLEQGAQLMRKYCK